MLLINFSGKDKYRVENEKILSNLASLNTRMKKLKNI